MPRSRLSGFIAALDACGLPGTFPSMATPSTPQDPPHPDDTLDLPPLDGALDGALDGEGEDAELAPDDLDTPESEADPFDDATFEDEPHDVALGEHPESGWLMDCEEASAIDLGPLDLGLAEEGKLLEDAEPEAGVLADDDLGGDDEDASIDSGEEGPLAEDEELREEDLPALDADEDGDVADEALFDRAMFVEQEELRWDDRAWSRVPSYVAGEDAEDSGPLPVFGEDPANEARDAVWRGFDESGRVNAATFLPGGSVVLAIDAALGSRPLLVRVQSDGAARIIAEIEPSADGDGEGCTVRGLRWDAGRGVLIASGSFGTQAFRPA